MDRRLHATTQHGTAPRDVNPVADGDRAHRVPWRWHRRVRCPSVGGGIVALHLAENRLLPRSIDDSAFTPHGVKAIAIDHQSMARSCGGHGGAQFPSVLLGQIDVVQVGVVFKGVEPPANDMDTVVVDDAADVVARAGQRFAQAPAIGNGVINLVPSNASALFGWRRRTAQDVNLAIEHNRCGRATGSL